MPATTATTEPRDYVLIDGDGHEVRRYTQKGAPNRRAKAIRGGRVLRAAEWQAEQAEAGDPVAQLEAAEATDAEDLAAAEEERVAAADAAYERYATRRVPRGFEAAAAHAMHVPSEPAEEQEAPAEAHPFTKWAPSPEGVNPLRDWLQLTEEETAAASPPAADPEAAAAKLEERRAAYAAAMEAGPTVEVEQDGSWVFTRRYECDRRAARAARGMATRLKRAQAHARVVAADGTVLLDTDTDQLCIDARREGRALSGLRPV
jgi:hypothetical protein